ncbi:MAG: PLP-dependent aminotransferase family protein [Acidobacteriota bacterium]
MRNDQGPIYLAIADAVGADVRAGRLQPGERLPTHRDLAKQLGVNVMTISRAYAEASRRGLTEGEVGRGTFVRRRERNATRFEPDDTTAERRVDFHFNLPAGDPSILNAAELLGELALDAPDRLLHTGYTTTGSAEHRAIGAEWLARSGVQADPARILVCGGAQHAMTITFASLAGPGDLVLTEELTYPGMKALASVLGLRLHGLAMDAEGIEPESFETACRRSNPKALYCMPTAQNPTGMVMGETRRREIAEIARHHGVALVEDDTYRYLCPEPPPPLATFAPELAYFLTGTSKNLTAGLRIGYLLAPDDASSPAALMARIEGNVAALTWMAAPLMAEITSRFIRSGQADEMVAWKRREAVARRRTFDRLLPDSGTPSHPGSSHLWLPLPRPWRGEEFVSQAARRGVAVTAAEAFVVGRASAPHAVRLCLGTPRRRQQVEEGLTTLRDMLAAAPEVSRSIV